MQNPSVMFRAPVIVVKPAFPRHAAVELQWVSGVDPGKIYLSGGVQIGSSLTALPDGALMVQQGNKAWSPTVYLWRGPDDHGKATSFLMEHLKSCTASKTSSVAALLRAHSLQNPFDVYSRRCGDAEKHVSVRGLRFTLPVGAPAVCHVILPKGEEGERLTMGNIEKVFC